MKKGQIGQLENVLAIALRNTFMKMLPAKVNMKLIDKYFSYDVTKLDFSKPGK